VADLVSERYQKLQTEFAAKLRENLELEVLCNSLRAEALELRREKEELREEVGRLRREREECGEKLERGKEEVLRLRERVKYQEIERGILLRVKEEHQALARSNLQLRNQHELMKKNILASTHHKHNSISTNSLHNNHSIFSNPSFHKKNPSTPAHSKAHPFGSPQCPPCSDNDDDNISLDLSEFSLDNIQE
jgi:hypothetical protein